MYLEIAPDTHLVYVVYRPHIRGQIPIRNVYKIGSLRVLQRLLLIHIQSMTYRIHSSEWTHLYMSRTKHVLGDSSWYTFSLRHIGMPGSREPLIQWFRDLKCLKLRKGSDPLIWGIGPKRGHNLLPHCEEVVPDPKKWVLDLTAF